MESSPHNNPFQSNNHSPYSLEREWTLTVSIQLGKDFAPPLALLVRLNNIAVTPEGETRRQRGWRPIVWKIDRGWCNRLKWVKASTRRIHTHIRRRAPAPPAARPPSVPREGIFHAFKPPGSDKPLTTSAYCDTFVGPEEVSTTMPPLTGMLERKHTLFHLKGRFDWLAQSNFLEWEMAQKTLTQIYLFIRESQWKYEDAGFVILDF